MGNIELIVKERKSAVLTPSQLPCLSRTPTVNLTSGCAHGCLYCYGRSYSQYPGDDKVVLYSNMLQKLKEELRRKRVKPAFVYFSPSTDVFQPIEAVLNLAYDIFELLLTQKIGIAFVTKGTIPAEHMALFEAHPAQVRAQIGLISLSPSILHVFEPNCAPVDVRVRQIERLIQMRVETEVRLDPILPGLTDNTDTLQDLFCTLSILGVKRVALNILYLRAALCKFIRDRVADKPVCEQLLARYASGTTIRVCNERFSQIALPRVEREEIFTRVIRLADACGIQCHCCGCMNPDISNGNCNLTGEWESEEEEILQLRLL